MTYEESCCPNCNAPITIQTNKSTISCPFCGTIIKNPFFTHPDPDDVGSLANQNNYNTQTNNNPTSQPTTKKTFNKWVSLILCIFLGYFGVHKFYEGKVLWGVVYLFTCGLFLIGIIVDIFVILSKPTNYSLDNK